MREGERDDEEHNSEEETLPLEIVFLPLNQDSLNKRVKLAVGFILSGCPVSSLSPIGIGMSTTDWYRDVGKDYEKDVDGNVNARLAYAYDTPPPRVDKGDRPFFLTSMTTLVTRRLTFFTMPKRHLKASC